MNSICIVTDGSAQFTKMSFGGQSNIRIIPLNISVIANGKIDQNTKILISDFPQTVNDFNFPKLLPIPTEHFRSLFLELSQSFDAIVGIFMSSYLSDCFNNAQKASGTIKGKTPILLIDSHSTSIGLGSLVQFAAELSAAGESPLEIERQVRSLIPLSYTVICVPNLSYLYVNSYLEKTQAYIGEMLGLYPLFTLEEGRLTPLEKVRSQRHVIGYFQEFLDEFENMQHIAFLQGNQTNFKEARQFQDYSRENFPETPFFKALINLPVAALFGPKVLGLFLLEKPCRTSSH